MAVWAVCYGLSFCGVGQGDKGRRIPLCCVLFQDIVVNRVVEIGYKRVFVLSTYFDRDGFVA